MNIAKVIQVGIFSQTKEHYDPYIKNQDLSGAYNLSSTLLRHGCTSVASRQPFTAVNGIISRTFLTLTKPTPSLSHAIKSTPPPTVATTGAPPVRTKITYSRTTGGSRTVTAVTRRFFRLHNGQWIRPQVGRRKKLWAKTPSRIHRLQDHVICNNAQSRLLDRMVGPYFKKPRHYPDDPYAPYHKLENLPHYKVLKNKPRFLP